MAEFLRQQSLINQAKLRELRVAIIGCGSIGSFTALTLTKMGVQHLTLWDNDVVDLHNLSNQFYAKEALEAPKVVAVAQECQRYTPTEVDVEIFNEFYSGQNLDKFDIVIALTDNIEGRRAAFEASKASIGAKLFIDGRMGAETLRTFCLDPKNQADCEKYFKDYIDGVVNEELPCTARTIIYNVQMVASLISSFVKKHVQGEATPFQVIFSFTDYTYAKSKLGSS